MISLCLHVDAKPQRFSRASSSLLAAFLLATLTGCQSLTPNSSSPQIRIVDASPDAPMLDVYRGSTALTYNLAFGNTTSYVSTDSGTEDFGINFSGSRQLFASVHASFHPSARYTLLIGSSISTIQPIVLEDRSTPAPPGQVLFRFVNQIDADLPLDIFLVPSGASPTTVVPILTHQTSTAITAYLSVPVGTYRILVYAASSVPSRASAPIYIGPTVLYPAGSARTIILTDQRGTLAVSPETPSIQAITIVDFDPRDPL